MLKLDGAGEACVCVCFFFSPNNTLFGLIRISNRLMT